MTTKKGGRFVRCKVEDFTGQVECVMWPDDYARYAERLRRRQIFLFEAGRRGRPAERRQRWSSCGG